MDSEASPKGSSMSKGAVIVYSQPGWVFCEKVKEFLSQNKVEFADRNIAVDEGALNDLEKLGYMTTPVTVVNREIVVGFDVPRLRAVLHV
jgi:glutaredoxin-like protein NrdH